MLTKIGIENFKAFGLEQQARFAPITLIYGPNSAGKSSLLQSLLLLKQSAEAARRGAPEIIPQGALIDLGTFRNIVHRHSSDLSPTIGIGVRSETAFTGTLEATIELTISPADDDKPEATTGRIARATYHPAGHREWTIKIPQALSSHDRLFTESSKEEHFCSFASPDSMQACVLYLQDALSRDTLFTVGRGFSPDVVRSAATQLLRGLHTIGIDRWLPDSFSRHVIAQKDDDPVVRLKPDLERVFSAIPGVLSQSLREMIFLGPVRAAPTRLRRLELGRTGLDHVGEFVGSQLAGNWGQTHGVDRLNEWAEIFDIPLRFSAGFIGDKVLGRSVWLKATDVRTGTEVALPDVGYGISQLLPILVAGLRAPGHTICVEQPELHLHPRQQGHLADFFVWTVTRKMKQMPYEVDKGTARFVPTQWVVESHSEALISRLQRRIREGQLVASQVSVLYVEPSLEGARLSELRLDDRGEFTDEWPGGFFEDSYWDLLGDTR